MNLLKHGKVQMSNVLKCEVLFGISNMSTIEVFIEYSYDDHNNPNIEIEDVKFLDSNSGYFVSFPQNVIDAFDDDCRVKNMCLADIAQKAQIS